MNEKLMTLDEIERTASRWLHGDSRACVLSLVEHVRALTPAPVVEPPIPQEPKLPTCPECGGKGWFMGDLGRDMEEWIPCIECRTPAPVPARAEAGGASATRDGGELHLRWTALSGVYHEQRYDVRTTTRATDMVRALGSMLASAREEGRREGLEEAAKECDRERDVWAALLKTPGMPTHDGMVIANAHATARDLGRVILSLIGDKP